MKASSKAGRESTPRLAQLPPGSPRHPRRRFRRAPHPRPEPHEMAPGRIPRLARPARDARPRPTSRPRSRLRRSGWPSPSHRSARPMGRRPLRHRLRTPRRNRRPGRLANAPGVVPRRRKTPARRSQHPTLPPPRRPPARGQPHHQKKPPPPTPGHATALGSKRRAPLHHRLPFRPFRPFKPLAAINSPSAGSTPFNPNQPSRCRQQPPFNDLRTSHATPAHASPQHPADCLLTSLPEPLPSPAP